MSEDYGYRVTVTKVSDHGGGVVWVGDCLDFGVDDGYANDLVLTLVREIDDDGPVPTCDIRFVEDGDRCTCEDCLNETIEASPIYAVFVGDIEFEETRSPDPAEAWGLFLPIMERNPGFADRGVWLGEVEVGEGFNE